MTSLQPQPSKALNQTSRVGIAIVKPMRVRVRQKASFSGAHVRSEAWGLFLGKRPETQPKKTYKTSSSTLNPKSLEAPVEGGDCTPPASARQQVQEPPGLVGP